MDEQTQALLAQLKDIHIPQNPHWWPPAPGWWLVALLMGFLAWKLIRFLVKTKRNAKMKKFALAELDRIALQATEQPPSWGHQQLAVLMKRIARQAFPDDNVAAFDNKTWKHFLLSTPPKSGAFDTEEIVQSQQAAYQANPSRINTATFEACRTWIRQHYPSKQASTPT